MTNVAISQKDKINLTSLELEKKYRVVHSFNFKSQLFSVVYLKEALFFILMIIIENSKIHQVYFFLL